MCYGIIYKIENKINGKIYIGQTTRTFYERYGGDIRNTHNEHLKRSIEIYGVENFEIDECVCKCDTKEELDRVEQFYIYVYDSANPEHGYNLTFGGEGGTPNEETRKKISEALSGEKNPMWGKNAEDYMTPEAIKIKRERLSKANKEAWTDPERIKKQSEKFSGENNPMYGKNCEDYMSEDTIKIRRERLSEATSGENNPMYGKNPFANKTEEEMKEIGKKISEKQFGKNSPRAKAVIQLDKQNNFIKKFDCMNDAARETGTVKICEVCKGYRKSSGGYKWMYEDDYLDLLQYAF